MKAILDDMNFLASRADKSIKNYAVGNIVEAKVEITKDYGVLCKFDEGKLTGFIRNENHTKKYKPETTLKCVILDIDTEKSIADILPITTESKTKSKHYIGKDIQAKIVLVKDGYSILSITTHPDIICISYSDIGSHGDIIDGTITEQNLPSGSHIMHPYLIF